MNPSDFNVVAACSGSRYSDIKTAISSVINILIVDDNKRHCALYCGEYFAKFFEDSPFLDEYSSVSSIGYIDINHKLHVVYRDTGVPNRMIIVRRYNRSGLVIIK